MAGATVAGGGLMPNQKDERDLWTCKDCGWKYPNAKPSPKIRKNHKKHCPGKAGAGADVHAAGSESDASVTEHDSARKGTLSSSEAATPPAVESKDRSFDFAAAAVPADQGDTKGGAGPADNGTAPEGFPQDDTSSAISENQGENATEVKTKEAPVPSPSAVPETTGATGGGLLPHQKDEHDIWVCKECGWKYPNAKPSPKIRKNHKKHCPGKAGADVDATRSEDDASETEHDLPKTDPGTESTTEKEAEPVVGLKDRSLDFTALAAEKGDVKGGDVDTAKEFPADETSTAISENQEQVSTEAKEEPQASAVPVEKEAEPVVGLKDRSLDFTALAAEKGDVKGGDVDTAKEFPADDTSTAISENQEQVSTEAKEEPQASAVPVDVSPTGGLMLHQKDEHDVWICKNCGWKYPNAKPSAKIRKNHKKHCSGKEGGHVGGGSSDEADSDHEHKKDEQHSVEEHPVSSQVAPAAEAAETQAPANASRDIDFAALKESKSPEVEKEDTAPPAEATAPVKEKTFAEAVSESTPAEETGAGDSKAKSREFSGSAVPASESKEAPTSAAAGGLMPHQKDEEDIWICKECGWRYPNARPSPKIRKAHKKKCPGSKTAKSKDAGSSDDASSDDERSA